MNRIFEAYLNNQVGFIDDIINTFPFGIVLIDTEQIIHYVNGKFYEYFKPHNNLIGEAFHINLLNCNVLEEGTSYQLLSLLYKDEIIIVHKKPLYDRDKNIAGYVLLFQDFEQLQLEKIRYQQLANYDYLTKLVNRRGLYQYYEALDPQLSRHFLFLDIDNFKIINDVYGHSYGDELLIMVSSKLRECAPNTFISRIGGDEFVIILPGALSEYEVTHIARRILRRISGTEYQKDILYNLSTSIGIVLDQKKDCKLDDILYKCDLAMCRAKQNGKNQFIIYNSMEQEVKERRTIEEEMHQALAMGEFIIYLQPKVNMLTSKLYGAEALVRWQHPKDGLRFPDKFISIFEKTGFIVDLDMYVFEEVCKLKQRWKNNEILRNIVISVNMSRLHFYREDFVEKIIGITYKYEVNPNEIEIEITESIFLKNSKEILEKISQLKNAGFYISVDDFGSGYSSLNILKDIPADILKLDRGFLQLSDNDERSKTVIKNIIAMGKDLKLDMIAEGVESLDQIQFLTSCGCELAQGYYYSRPIPIPNFEDLAKEYLLRTRSMLELH